MVGCYHHASRVLSLLSSCRKFDLAKSFVRMLSMSSSRQFVLRRHPKRISSIRSMTLRAPFKSTVKIQPSWTATVNLSHTVHSPNTRNGVSTALIIALWMITGHQAIRTSCLRTANSGATAVCTPGVSRCGRPLNVKHLRLY